MNTLKAAALLMEKGASFSRRGAEEAALVKQLGGSARRVRYSGSPTMHGLVVVGERKGFMIKYVNAIPRVLLLRYNEGSIRVHGSATGYPVRDLSASTLRRFVS